MQWIFFKQLCNPKIFYYFNFFVLHRIAEGTPNARTCLLHQKLQLLNSCIRKSLEGKISLPGNSSEDEFFDCSEGENDEHPPWDRPVGRLSRFGDAIMKNGSPLYIPRTQVCMTYTPTRTQVYSVYLSYIFFRFRCVKGT